MSQCFKNCQYARWPTGNTFTRIIHWARYTGTVGFFPLMPRFKHSAGTFLVCSAKPERKCPDTWTEPFRLMSVILFRPLLAKAEIPCWAMIKPGHTDNFSELPSVSEPEPKTRPIKNRRNLITVGISGTTWEHLGKMKAGKIRELFGRGSGTSEFIFTDAAAGFFDDAKLPTEENHARTYQAPRFWLPMRLKPAPPIFRKFTLSVNEFRQHPLFPLMQQQAFKPCRTF